ncbi:MAG: hypothetical protein A2Z21_07915 [Candidatus Fraserbacteria bacterium RBG_16_55_9]|uniref:Cytochrome b/b6 N-terminal region profile domain-containing protein n=1 Tax=Fraserbacteria sp. (strain RBG_16_55_9) TaxID=1817864 RepID=A0A1F5UQB7_FRAXR|nr:MAG: hypothetical protein A2Z21_07915 [Candidatus Fraserbacteria bacterium RBG_16_55_9]
MTFWERTRALIQQELELPVPSQFHLGHFLGGAVLFLFLIEIVTGILLMVYYQPTVTEAHQSIQYIMSTAQLGWLVRGLHSWGANLLILVALLHLLRVGLYGAYRERELNWAIGVILLLLVLAFGFTGMLLLWDQQAFWTTDAARLALERIPLIGKLFLDFLWGGVELGEGALLRFYVFHVGLLPWVTTLLIAVHLYLVARQGLFVPASREQDKPVKPVEGVSDHAEENVR